MPAGRALARPLLAAAFLLLATEAVTVVRAAAGSGAAGRKALGAADGAAAAGTGAWAGAAAGVRVQFRNYCNKTSGELLEGNGHTPLPCTEQQEAGALDDLLLETQDGDVNPSLSILDISTCNASDPANYTVPVDIFDSELAEVSLAIQQEYVEVMGNESYWQTDCQGDLTPDTYNACTQPQTAIAEGLEGTRFKVNIKLSCSALVNDTVALEAYAFRGTEGGNTTILVESWEEIPLPPAGQ